MRTIDDFRWSFRLFPDAMSELRVRPDALLHVGAHHGQEVPQYLAAGFQRITLVEPDPENCAVIASQPWIDAANIGIVAKACGSKPGRATFHRTDDTAFSGLQRDIRMSDAASFPVDVVRIADIQVEARANVLVVDTQGTELDALASADLDPLDLIIVEAQDSHRGAPGAYLPDLLAWCRSIGWLPRIQWRRDAHWADTLLTPRRALENLP
jgi:FkbM family methyltransferase